MKKEGYKVTCHTFKGGNEKTGFTYELTFNKSLVHTGRHRGIEQGLDRYVRREKWTNLRDAIRDTFYSMWDILFN